MEYIPFFVPIRWCQYLLQVILAGYEHGAQRKKRKCVDSGILVVNGREYQGYHDLKATHVLLLEKHHRYYIPMRTGYSAFKWFELELNQEREEKC